MEERPSLANRGNPGSIKRLVHTIGDQSRSIKRRGSNNEPSVDERQRGDGHHMHKRAPAQHATLVMPCPLDYDHIALLLSETELRMNSFDNNAP